MLSTATIVASKGQSLQLVPARAACRVIPTTTRSTLFSWIPMGRLQAPGSAWVRQGRRIALDHLLKTAAQSFLRCSIHVPQLEHHRMSSAISLPIHPTIQLLALWTYARLTPTTPVLLSRGCASEYSTRQPSPLPVALQTCELEHRMT